MRTIINPSHRVYPSAAAAQAVADMMRIDDDDGWTYAVVIDPSGTGKAIIAVYDAAGFFIANLF